MIDKERDALIGHKMVSPKEPSRQIVFVVTDCCWLSVSEATVCLILTAEEWTRQREVKSLLAAGLYVDKSKQLKWQMANRRDPQEGD